MRYHFRHGNTLVQREQRHRVVRSAAISCFELKLAAATTAETFAGGEIVLAARILPALGGKERLELLADLFRVETRLACGAERACGPVLLQRRPQRRLRGAIDVDLRPACARFEDSRSLAILHQQ